jgi:rRNA maturation protein Rpf1
MILLTTSRQPTNPIRTLCRDLSHSVPGIMRVNRGKMSLHEAGEKAVSIGADKIIVLDRWKGGFCRIRLLKIGQGIVEVPPCLNITKVKFRREFRSSRKTPGRLFIDKSGEAELGTDKLKKSFSDFLELPIVNVLEAPSEYEATMRVMSGASRFIEIRFYTLPRNIEIGPRILISNVVWQT